MWLGYENSGVVAKRLVVAVSEIKEIQQRAGISSSFKTANCSQR